MAETRERNILPHMITESIRNATRDSTIEEVLEEARRGNTLAQKSIAELGKAFLTQFKTVASSIISSRLSTVNAINEGNRPDFQQEGRDEANMAIQERIANGIEELINVEPAQAQSSGGMSGLFKTGGKLAFLGAGAAMIAGFMKMIAPKLLNPKAIKAGLKRGGKFLLRGLAKIAIPVLIATAVYDFFKGVFNPKEITGREGIAASIQAGLSSVLSGLTLGLIDAKMISESIDWLGEQIVVAYKTMATEFGWIFTKVGNHFKELFTDIGNFLTGAWHFITDPVMSIFETVKTIDYSGMVKSAFADVGDFFNIKGIGDAINSVKDKIKELLAEPFEYIANMFSDDDTYESVMPDNVIKNSGVRNKYSRQREIGMDFGPVQTKIKSIESVRRGSIDKISNGRSENRRDVEQKPTIIQTNNTNNTIAQAPDMSTQIPDPTYYRFATQGGF